MTEIRVDSPSLTVYSEMQGFAGASLTDKATPFSSPPSNSYMERARGATVGSLHSEPDIDTIMPLPGSSRMSFRSGTYSPVQTRNNSFLMSAENQREREGVGSSAKLQENSVDQQLEPGSGGFTNVEAPMFGHDVFGDDLTATALESCKKTVLRPLLAFLKVIGWRRFHPRRYDLHTPKWLTVVNVLWPTSVCLLILASCVTQIITCFRRDSVPQPNPNPMTITYSNVSNNSNTSDVYVIDCRRHIMTTFVIPDLLLISAFAYGLYIFRWAQTEQLSTLTETVFLGHIDRHGKYSHKRLTLTLQLLIVVGVLWILFSLGNSCARAYSFHLLDKNTEIDFTHIFQTHVSSSLALRWVLVIFTISGFIVLDIAYTAVVINYCLQCQLLVYLLWNIGERMKAKEWDIDQSIKEIRNGRDFLSQLNNHLSKATSLLLFIFLTSAVQAMYGFYSVDGNYQQPALVATLALMASIQWTFMLILTLVQAARVTRSCTKLKKCAAEVRSRPYSYKDTPQLDLDSLLIFTGGVSMSAKLVSVPVTPAIVVFGSFLGGFLLFMFFQYDEVGWTPWV